MFYSYLHFSSCYGPAPIFNATYVKKFLFEIPIELFVDIVAKVTPNNDRFRLRTDVVGKMGLSPVQKLCLAVLQLTSGLTLVEHYDN